MPRGEYALVTLHRPANVDDPAALAALLAALGEIAARCPVVLPAHPRAAGRLTEAGISSRIQVIPPAGYLDFICLQASARLVLTDSGGVQEETTVLGVPCLTLRDNTERPITLTEGTNQLVGRDPERIVKTAFDVLEAPPVARRPDAVGRPGRPADRRGPARRRAARPGTGARPTSPSRQASWPAGGPAERIARPPGPPAGSAGPDAGRRMWPR